MSDSANSQHGKVEAFPAAPQSAVVSGELNRLLEVLTREFPGAVRIHFEFDGNLQVHIDVRKGEEIAMIEANLPKLNRGMFSQVRHGGTPGHAFLHRISANVEC